MPNLFNNFKECFGFSHTIMSQVCKTSLALSEISFKFPMGVATKYKKVSSLFIIIFVILIIGCTPKNLLKQSEQQNSDTVENNKQQSAKVIDNFAIETTVNEEAETKNQTKVPLPNIITILFSSQDDEALINQFINVLEIGVFNKNLKDILFEVKIFNDHEELKNIILNNTQAGKIFIGPINKADTKVAKNLCNDNTIIFSFSSDTELAGNCLYLINFFPQNELEQLFKSLDESTKVTLIYPENEYGYMINSIIDEVINDTESVLVNRASYKNDLSNVREAIKELGKYELRKYELERQKQILKSKTDKESLKRLEKLKKFKTTTDYDFTHILIADYGLNLLQVAPLLPYYDIDPNIVQFLGTGVIDDENFFYEPSLQGTIFPGVEKKKRQKLISQYNEVYEDSFLRISTLPYDLLGILNYIYKRNLNMDEVVKLLNSSTIRFDGLDSGFYFNNNMIERDLDILQILNGKALKIN